MTRADGLGCDEKKTLLIHSHCCTGLTNGIHFFIFTLALIHSALCLLLCHILVIKNAFEGLIARNLDLQIPLSHRWLHHILKYYVLFLLCNLHSVWKGGRKSFSIQLSLVEGKKQYLFVCWRLSLFNLMVYCFFTLPRHPFVGCWLFQIIWKRFTAHLQVHYFKIRSGWLRQKTNQKREEIWT